MSENIYYQLDPFFVCLVWMITLLAALEIGFWLQRVRTAHGSSSRDKSDIGLILAGVLTLLALLLGFTYSMSDARFETRRQLVVEEANSIGTTYLRAKTLPEPHSSEVQALLRQYTALRVKTASMTAATPEKIREADNRTKQIHSLLWSHAVAAAKESPTPITAIFLVSLNEMIDLHTTRLAAFRNRVPLPIYVVLFVVSAVAMWLAGFCFGSSAKRVRILTTTLVLLVVSVVWLILDLDQPTRGAIKTSQQSLTDLNRDLNGSIPPPAPESH